MAQRRSSSATTINPTAPTPPADAVAIPSVAPQRVARQKPVPAPVASVVASPLPARSAGVESKQARMIALLRRPAGATIAELMTATGWMSHSVRGAISGVLKRSLGLRVESDVEPDRGRVYRIGHQARVSAPPECR